MYTLKTERNVAVVSLSEKIDDLKEKTEEEANDELYLLIQQFNKLNNDQNKKQEMVLKIITYEIVNCVK